MPCYSPITGYRSRVKNDSGKYPVVFNMNDGWIDKPVQVPCGQCIGCRLERSRQWAMRCVHEASLYDQNCFITLTFNDDYLSENRSLCKSDFQNFMKRLRKCFLSIEKPDWINKLYPSMIWIPFDKIRYFHCGEYGDKLDRPHHHACLFGLDFPDKVLWSVRDNVKLYRSKILENLWEFGHSTIGDVTFESAAYVARYCMKKITGDKADAYYAGRVPEYTTMSRRPGIGLDWLKKFHADVYPDDKVVVRGDVLCKPPKYYDDKYSEIDLTKEKFIDKLKLLRKKKAEGNPHNTYARLAVRESIKRQRVAQLRRSYENVSV